MTIGAPAAPGLETAAADSRRLSSAASAAVAAYGLTAVGCSLTGSLVLLAGVPLTVAGWLAGCVAARRARQAPASTSYDGVYRWLSVLAAIGYTSSPRDHPPLWYHVLHYAHPTLGVIAVGVLATGGLVARRRAVWTMVASASILYLLTPVAIPRPYIDVWAWTQAAARALVHGGHPYLAHADDIYRGGLDLGYTVTVYPYMPATVLVHAAVVSVVGDFRYGLALCLPITIALVRAAGRRLGVDGRLVDALTLAVVLFPRGAYIVGSGWNEPLLVVTVAAFVYLAAAAPDGIGAGIAFLLLPALKQYVVAPALIYAADRGARRHVGPIAAGAIVALATIVPFLVWNRSATLDGIVFQVRPAVAFRPDSTSIAALVVRLTGFVPWHWLPEVVQLGVGAVGFAALGARGLGGLLLASALSLSASFLVAPQAFINYYYFVGMLLVLAALALSRGGAEVR